MTGSYIEWASRWLNLGSYPEQGDDAEGVVVLGLVRGLLEQAVVAVSQAEHDRAAFNRAMKLVDEWREEGKPKIMSDGYPSVFSASYSECADELEAALTGKTKDS